jgi:hypothetical protein
VTAIPLDELRPRLQHMLELDGTTLTDGQLARLAERYPRCAGTDTWDVREYAQNRALGGREFRVVRGTSIQDVYASDERPTAAAVRAALNELETGTG